MFLTPDELLRLTGKVRYSAQRKALDALGIRYVRAASGEPLVRPDDLDGRKARERNGGHRWDRIGGTGATVAPLARTRR